MNSVFDAALEVQTLFQEQGWKFCIIGGLAVIRWGRMRATQDADFSLLTGFGDEDDFLSVIDGSLNAREAGELEFARAARVYRAFASNGAPVDIALAGLPFEEELIDRATQYEFRPDCALITCSASDLIVMKAFAGRDQDWADVRNVAASQWDTLDWEVIEQNLEFICEMGENFTSVPKFHSIKQDLAKKLGRN